MCSKSEGHASQSRIRVCEGAQGVPLPHGQVCILTVGLVAQYLPVVKVYEVRHA
jgi:hypothetical protein